MFGPNRGRIPDAGGSCSVTGFVICTAHGVLLGGYSSRSVIRMIRPRRVKWTGYLASTGRKEIHTGFGRESQKERDH
jgi:hypothetical protein